MKILKEQAVDFISRALTNIKKDNKDLAVKQLQAAIKLLGTL